ncbi:hypothetical protein JMJ35_008721 [Cladonia borealis]|uniref:Uncharacterized protein n=1 Tax=Cladonia borealis TaxID=184061 RepID=A0AA39QUU3_9LECA|nr:hypothetical protein JMJ35_008721 [Cladonia borealis]
MDPALSSLPPHRRALQAALDAKDLPPTTSDETHVSGPAPAPAPAPVAAAAAIDFSGLASAHVILAPAPVAADAAPESTPPPTKSSVAPHLRIIQAALDKPHISGLPPVVHPVAAAAAPAALDKPHISGLPPVVHPVAAAAAPAFVCAPAPRMSNPPRPFSMAPFRFSQSTCYHHQNQERWYASTKPLACEQKVTPKCIKQCQFLLVCKGCGAAMCAPCFDFYAPRHRRRPGQEKREERLKKN